MSNWEFNKSVAVNFSDYARKHIPNYDEVIDLCVDFCKNYSSDAKIIDVGCATGETLRRFLFKGFQNLYGLDNSADMLEFCPAGPTYYNSNKFPDEKFDVVIMNWTLHFIKDKISYLESIYKNLEKNGVLILSEKVSLDPLPISYYHQFKKNQGVGVDEIKEKEEQIKDVMFINDINWYMKELHNVGFGKIYIVNAHWCFATMICIK